MLFSRAVIDCYFDTESIQKFYDSLSKEFTGLELIWKSGRHTVEDTDSADSARIKKDGKTLYFHQGRNDRGILVLSRSEGKEEFVIKAAREAGLTSAPPSFSTAILCAIGFGLVFLFICSTRSELAVFLVACASILILGVILYAVSLKNTIKSNYTLINASSILILIGLLPLSPSSLLLFPLILALNRRNISNLAAKV